MAEFYKPQPIVVEREIREIDGVLESVVTERGNIANSEHLSREKEKWVEQHLFEVSRRLSVFEDTEPRAAAD